MVEKAYRLSSAYGYHIAVESCEPKNANASVILAHGFGSGKNSKYNRALLPILNELGLASVRFDFAGHYDSGGNTDELTIGAAASDLLTVIEETAKTSAPVIGLIGSSFGGSAILRALPKLPTLQFLVLRAPITNYFRTRFDQLGASGMCDWRDSGVTLIDSSQGQLKSSFEFVLDDLAYNPFQNCKETAASVRIIGGEKDEEAPLDELLKLSFSFGNGASLHMVEGADHSFSGDQEFAELVNLTREHIENVVE